MGKYVESVNAIGAPYAEKRGHGWSFYKMDWMIRLINPNDRPRDHRDIIIEKLLEEHPEYGEWVDLKNYTGPITQIDYGLIFQIGKDIENLVELF